MKQHHSIDYVELAGGDLESTKDFYRALCGWDFVDYGEKYAAITGAGIDGGLDATIQTSAVTTVILYSADLEQSLQQVVELGAEISQDIFAFPGGRRFHFIDPAGNEIAIWSDK